MARTIGEIFAFFYSILFLIALQFIISHGLSLYLKKTDPLFKAKAGTAVLLVTAAVYLVLMLLGHKTSPTTFPAHGLAIGLIWINHYAGKKNA